MSDLPVQGSPLPHTAALLPSRSATAACPCESNYRNWARMESGVRWSLSSSPPSLSPLLSLSPSDIPPHVVKWPASISFFSFFIRLSLPVTQKSINSFQVRSKAQYTVQVSPQPGGQLTLPLDRDQAGQMKGGRCHCSHTCEAVVNKWEVISTPLIYQLAGHQHNRIIRFN